MAKIVILGAGIMGLAVAHGLKNTEYEVVVYEAKSVAGGLCTSYYIRPYKNKTPQAYRFDYGGHWIFPDQEDNQMVQRFLQELKIEYKSYQKNAGVLFTKTQKYVPTPIQNSLDHLDPETAEKIRKEIEKATIQQQSFFAPQTMKDVMHRKFGKTLCTLFFDPFNRKYTAGLYSVITPLSEVKTPKATLKTKPQQNSITKTYNSTYIYPTKGLDHLIHKMTEYLTIRYKKQAKRIDSAEKIVYFTDGTKTSYDILISTIPLNITAKIANIKTTEPAPPYVSTLIINIGAIRGTQCPTKPHWLYIPDSENFHRIGFYSNVDENFLLSSANKKQQRVSIYIEKSYPNGKEPSAQELKKLKTAIIKELCDLKMITKIEVYDTKFIPIAYTYETPNSTWTQTTIQQLEKHGIHQIGRYGRWEFQGIATSIRQGLEIVGILNLQNNKLLNNIKQKEKKTCQL